MTELVGNSVLGLIAAVTLISMWRFHRDEHYRKFNLVDVLTARDGRISRPAVMEFGAWVVASWYLIIGVNRSDDIHVEFGVYLATFAIRAGHAAYMNAQSAQAAK